MQKKNTASSIELTVSNVSTRVDGLQQQKVEYFYYLSSSATLPIDGSWSMTKPTEQAGKFIWMKMKTTYVDGSVSESSPVRITGDTGSTGAAGATGLIGPSGKDGAPALHIMITPVWSGVSCTLNAHVFLGGEELTDSQIADEGVLNWYLNGSETKTASGKTLTRTITAKESWEVRLEG